MKHLTTKLILVTCLFCAALAACKRTEEGKNTGALGGKAETKPSEPAGVLASMPENAVGFFYWTTENDAYKKFRKSPYGAQQEGLPLVAEASPLGGVTTVLNKAGINPSDPAQMEELFREGVLFVLAPPQGAPAGKITGAVLFKSANAKTLGEKSSAIKKALTESQADVADMQLQGAQGFEFQPSKLVPEEQRTGEASEKVYFAWNDAYGIASNDAGVVQALSSGLGKPAPKIAPILTSEAYRSSLGGLPSEDQRFVTGFFDLARIMQLTPEAAQASQTFPFSSVTMGYGMTTAPEGVFRFAFAPKNDAQKTLFANLGSVTPAALLNSAPADPLLFLSFEGQAIRQLKDMFSAVQEPVDPLQSVKRVGISAKAAPVGQSILPLPELLIVVESTNPAELQGLLEGAVSAQLGQGGQAAWSERDIEGTKVRSMTSGLGFSALVATTPNLLIASTAEPRLRDALAGLKAGKGRFVSNLSPSRAAMFSEKRSIANLYVDSVQLASFLENIQGLLQMYAPKPQAGGEDPFRQAIESLKRKGTMLLSLTAEEKYLNANFSYEEVKAGS